MADAIVGVLTCVFATIALVLIDRSSRGAPFEAGGRVTLSHGVGWRALAGFVTVVFSIGTALMVVEAISTGFDLRSVGALLVVVTFLAIGVWMVLEGRKACILDVGGIHFGAPACTAHTMVWKDIRSVEYSPVWGRIAVRDVYGGVVRFSQHMRGIDHLWLLLEAHVESDIWSAANLNCRGRRGHPVRKGR